MKSITFDQEMCHIPIQESNIKADQIKKREMLSTAEREGGKEGHRQCLLFAFNRCISINITVITITIHAFFRI